MKKEIKAEFEAVLAGYDARGEAATLEREKLLTQRQQFERKWCQVRETVVIPALNQVADQILTPASWRCNVTASDKNITATLEVSRGNMRALSGSERPHVSFSVDASSPSVIVYAATQTEGGGEGKHDLSAITEDFVQQHALKFFRRLASERGSYS
jgi:hypothetical protein